MVKGKSGDVNVVELQGTVGSGPAIDRKKGFEEIIKAEPRIKFIRSQTGDFKRAECKKINVLYAHNDDMAIGVIQAIEEAGLKPSKDITIIAVDAGKLDVSVECCPVLGPQLMAAAKEFPTRTY
jgi:galactofuranose transport system substrate-binding protein